GRIVEPRDEEELCTLIARERAEGGTVRAVGAGHSSSPLVQTQDVLVSLRHFTEVHSHDRDAAEAAVGAGLTIGKIGQSLFEHGLAMHNTGDVDVQTLAGAVATGTHGTGRRLGNLATVLIGGRLVSSDGSMRDVAIENEPELIRGLR